MTIEHRAGAYRARVRRRGHDVSETFDTLEDARAWEAGVIAAIVRGEGPPRTLPEVPSPAFTASPVTVAGACREWLHGARDGVVRTRSDRRYREGSIHTTHYRLRLHVEPYFRGVPVAAITPGMLRRWLKQLQADTSASTARMAFDAFRPVLRLMHEDEVIPSNPAVGVRAPAAGEDARPIRYLTVAEGAALREAGRADEHPRIGAFIDLGLATGARRGELLGLTWGDVDLEGRAVTIARSFSLRTQTVGPTKSGKPRTVPIGPGVASRIRIHRLAVGRPGEDERVFPFDPRQAYARARGAVPSPLPTIHSMRHSAAAWWLASGLTVHAVADLLGHADPTLVIRLYGHAMPSEVNVAGDRLEAYLEASAAS